MSKQRGAILLSQMYLPETCEKVDVGDRLFELIMSSESAKGMLEVFINELVQQQVEERMASLKTAFGDGVEEETQAAAEMTAAANVVVKEKAQKVVKKGAKKGAKKGIKKSIKKVKGVTTDDPRKG